MPATTIPAKRIEWFATEMDALGCKVHDEVKPNGERVVTVTGKHWADEGSVFVTYTPASAKDGKGRRDSLFCMVFSAHRYPRKGQAVVEFHEAVTVATGLKDYSAHTHCEPARHVCNDALCTTCDMPESLHYLRRDHAFNTGASK